MPAWSGLWNDVANNPAGYSMQINRNPRRYGIKRTVNRESFRAQTALFNGLIGAATGSNVTATHKRIAAPAVTSIGSSGGARTIETITDINRNTAAADVTKLKEQTYNVRTRPSYPRDLSGNGGGAFT